MRVTTSPPQSTNAPSESNIRTFAAVCEIRGAEIYESYPVDTVQVVTAPEIDVQQDIVEVDSETPETIVV